MSRIPRDNNLDSTLALLSEGYTFISKRCERYNSDIFETRLLLRKAICTMGAEAARMFYYPERFTRRAAIPPTALMLLQDRGSVQTMDGRPHRHRKQLFMSLMTPASIQQLVDVTVEQWQHRLAKWVAMDQVVIHREVQKLLCRAVCRWAGIPLSEAEVGQRTREFAAMIDGAGAVGPRNWRGLLLRTRTERWAREIIEAIRTDKLHVPEGSTAHVTTWHRDLNGALLDPKIAAVELINVLRPTVAVARYVTFAALALHEYPECRERFLSGGDAYPELFAQEVRRFYPFFPAVAGYVKNEFEWRGYSFTKGTWVLLDIYGTNRDPRTWQSPETFQPERFRHWDASAFNFIPQGGGDHYQGHRCPGEWITLELLKAASCLLTRAMRYDVPEQDLRVDLSRMPAIPESGFVIRNVQAMNILTNSTSSSTMI